MNNKLRIVRDGVPQYVAPWVSDLSANARKMIGTGPSKLDPQGQLGLPIPDMSAAVPLMLDFGPIPTKARAKTLSALESELLAALVGMVEVWEGPRERAALGFAAAVVKARAAIAKAK